jgi:hypothetical protein
MSNPRMGDHATGLELQIEELVVRRDTARAHGWHDEARRLETDIAGLYLELAEVAEAATAGYRPATVHDVSTAADQVHPAA